MRARLAERVAALIAVSTSRRWLNILVLWRDGCRHYAASFIIYAQGDSGQFVLRLHLVGGQRSASATSLSCACVKRLRSTVWLRVCLLPDEPAGPRTRRHCCVSVVQGGSVPDPDPTHLRGSGSRNLYFPMSCSENRALVLLLHRGLNCWLTFLWKILEITFASADDVCGL